MTVAIGSLMGAVALLEAYNLSAEELLAQKEQEKKKILAQLSEEMRQATLKTSFNLLILPEGQNLKDWRAKDYALKEMPEDYVEKVADSGIVTVRHFLPSLQSKIEWPEQNNRTIILIGTRGEVPNLHKNPVKPLVEQVPAGTIVLGHELHRSLGVKVGDKVRLMGREFTVHECQEKRGTQDEITAWIHLREAQELLGKEGKINSILALGCLCAGPEGIARIRADLARYLPGTKVVEKGSIALARLEARTKVGKEAVAHLAAEKEKQGKLSEKREMLAGTLVPLIVGVCAVWIAVLGFSNVRDRRNEIGMLRAIGFRSRQVLTLFLTKSLAIGLIGGALGVAAGLVAGDGGAAAREGGAIGIAGAGEIQPYVLYLAALTAAVVLSLVAGWIPAFSAARQDPAAILQEE